MLTKTLESLLIEYRIKANQMCLAMLLGDLFKSIQLAELLNAIATFADEKYQDAELTDYLEKATERAKKKINSETGHQ